MNVTTTGLSEGDFHRLAVLHNGSMTDIISFFHSTSADLASYKSDCFAIGIDVERLPMVSASGENLSTGQEDFSQNEGHGDRFLRCNEAVPGVCAHFEKVNSIMDTVVEVFE